MPVEMRRLTFDDDEVLGILRNDLRPTGIDLPPGRIVGFKLLSEPEVGVEIEILPPVADAQSADDTDNDDGHDEEEIEEVETTKMAVDPAHVAAALMAFCMRSKIPMPRSAQKSLQIWEGELALVFSMTTKGVHQLRSEIMGHSILHTGDNWIKSRN